MFPGFPDPGGWDILEDLRSGDGYPMPFLGKFAVYIYIYICIYVFTYIYIHI